MLAHNIMFSISNLHSQGSFPRLQTKPINRKPLKIQAIFVNENIMSIMSIASKNCRR